MIDVHCHLQFGAFEKDYKDVAERAFADGVTIIINVGTKIDSSEKAVALASAYDTMYAIVGVHPHHADKVELGSDWIEEIERLAKQPKVVAIGEIGLDNFRYQSNGIVDPKTQTEIFLAQLELAHRLHLPLQIHNRHAGPQIIALLHAHKELLHHDRPGMFHCMSGNTEYLKQVLDLGFYVGFDGNITYKGLAPGEDTALSDLVSFAPLDRIVTETDSPYLTPIPYRGSRNEPKNVILVGEAIARIKGVSFEEVKAQTIQNARTLFDLNANS